LTAQRLIRKLCPKCKEKYKIDREVLQRLGVDAFCKERKSNLEFYKAKGCSYCDGIGYRGRIAILEIILLDDKIKEMIIEKAPEEEIAKYAKEEREYNPLVEDGIVKCMEGTTSVEEIMRVTFE